MNKIAPCGFHCLFSKKTDIWKFLHFSNLTLDDYYFSVVDAAVFSHCRRIEFLNQFPSSYLQELNPTALVCERLVLHLYHQDTCSVEIDDYEDFLKSKCEMIILVCDFYYLEVYCKNQAWLQKLMNNARSIPGASVQEKYEDTDTRTVMYV